MDTWLEEMKAWRKEMKTVQERTDASVREMKAEMRINDEKFEVLQGTLSSFAWISTKPGQSQLKK
jgi:hypothetical protein